MTLLAIWLLEDGVNPLVVLRKTLYPLMVQLAGAVSAVQLKLIALEEDVVAVRPLGAEGTEVHEPPPEEEVVAVACADGAEVPSESTASIL